ncbi:MAG: hypothetical protein ABI240_18205 [Sphingomonas sp.]
MELLLFLSALLSALTGAISGVRAPEAQVHQACGVIAGSHAAETVQVAPLRAVRAYLALAGGWQSRATGILHSPYVGPALFAAIPLYLDKPRE